MSSLRNTKLNAALHVEDSHDASLRKGLSFIFDVDIAGLATNVTRYIRFTTGVNAVKFEGGDITINQERVVFTMYEDTTFTVNGVENTTYVRNLNRMDPLATQLQFFDTPTVNDVGSLVLHQAIVGTAGQNVNQPGVGTGGQEESVILKPNTEHVILLKNESILAVNVETHFFYHEVNPREYQ